ncbi:hypothetical protein E2C01_010359 [Portunus trituberculatus]|uniref:Uncharacterized protein n=1 Tax=Portunus trituberculatus TaxID=210409 RepID=A0A5B7D856_PORTR|nr:hypothetical protein [Portunus trituberculatus]
MKDPFQYNHDRIPPEPNYFSTGFSRSHIEHEKQQKEKIISYPFTSANGKVLARAVSEVSGWCVGLMEALTCALPWSRSRGLKAALSYFGILPVNTV